MTPTSKTLKDVGYDPVEDIYKHDATAYPDKKYTITPFRISGGWMCDCPNFTFRCPQDGCKHIQRIKVIDELRQKVNLAVPLIDIHIG